VARNWNSRARNNCRGRHRTIAIYRNLVPPPSRRRARKRVPTEDPGTRYLSPKLRLIEVAAHLGLWPRPATGELAAKDALELRDEGLIAKRVASGLRGSQRLTGGFVFVACQEGGEVADTVEKRRHRDEAVIGAGEMGSGARPGSFIGARDEACADRVHRDVSRRGDQMGIVHGDGREPALE